MTVLFAEYNYWAKAVNYFIKILNIPRGVTSITELFVKTFNGFKQVAIFFSKKLLKIFEKVLNTPLEIYLSH